MPVFLGWLGGRAAAMKVNGMNTPPPTRHSRPAEPRASSGLQKVAGDRQEPWHCGLEPLVLVQGQG